MEFDVEGSDAVDVCVELGVFSGVVEWRDCCWIVCFDVVVSSAVDCEVLVSLSVCFDVVVSSTVDCGVLVSLSVVLGVGFFVGLMVVSFFGVLAGVFGSLLFVVLVGGLFVGFMVGFFFGLLLGIVLQMDLQS